MRWLPPLPGPLHSVVLPLADRSAAALVDVLLQREAPASLQRLDEALRLDAALALWTVCRCSSQRTCAPSFDVLVADLLCHLPACLEWPDEQPFDVPAALADSFAQLAAENVATARQAAGAAGAVRAPPPDREPFRPLPRTIPFLPLGEPRGAAAALRESSRPPWRGMQFCRA